MALLSLFLLLYVRLSKRWNLFQAYIGNTNLVAYQSNNVNRALEFLELARAFYDYVVMLYQNDPTQLSALMCSDDPRVGTEKTLSTGDCFLMGPVMYSTCVFIPVSPGRSRTQNWLMEGFLPITVLLAYAEVNHLSIPLIPALCCHSLFTISRLIFRPVKPFILNLDNFEILHCGLFHNYVNNQRLFCLFACLSGLWKKQEFDQYHMGLLSSCMRRICSNKYSAVVFGCWYTLWNGLIAKIKTSNGNSYKRSSDLFSNKDLLL